MNNRESRQARALLASIAREASGHSLLMICPFCNGGNSQESSLVLTLRDDGAFYCCHRASCVGDGRAGAYTGRVAYGATLSKVSAFVES